MNYKTKKMKNKILVIISFLAMTLLSVSCLKDDIGLDWTEVEGTMYAEVLYMYSGFQVTPMESAPDRVRFGFIVNLATNEPPTEDIVVTLGVNEDVIGEYNSLKETNYVLYPYIELVTPTVTIEAGTRSAWAYVEVWNANELDPCDNFMAPISVVEATGGVLLANPLGQGSCLMALPINNPWAGDYHAVGYRDHPTAGFQPFDYASQAVSTVNCETVHKAQVGNYAGYGLDIKVTQNKITVGGVECNKCELQITDMADPTDQIIYPDFEGNPTNYYNPVTRQFDLYYAYNVAAPRIIREVLTRN
jgi:hypothetical protein